MYVCMYVCMYKCEHVYIYIYIYIHMYMSTYMRICAYVCVYIYMNNICVRMHVLACVHFRKVHLLTYVDLWNDSYKVDRWVEVET